MVEKKSAIAGFIKETIQPALEPLSKVEAKVREAIGNIGEMNQKEVKKVFDEVLKRVNNARAEVEKAFSEGIQKALGMLNLPSREDLEKIDKKVNKLAKDLQSLKTKKAK